MTAGCWLVGPSGKAHQSLQSNFSSVLRRVSSKYRSNTVANKTSVLLRLLGKYTNQIRCNIIYYRSIYRDNFYRTYNTYTSQILPAIARRNCLLPSWSRLLSATTVCLESSFGSAAKGHPAGPFYPMAARLGGRLGQLPDPHLPLAVALYCFRGMSDTLLTSIQYLDRIQILTIKIEYKYKQSWIQL